ncbi:MAG: nuclease [Betaproteobacteria bacterium HGW-Betaproteobacteria-9]|jgi:endonuclease YncB( thermonuclease family)|nr:MAG: nuclease [Betaproteobacteria bacterium HGW-Betaproteobacteria-9]
MSFPPHSLFRLSPVPVLWFCFGLLVQIPAVALPLLKDPPGAIRPQAPRVYQAHVTRVFDGDTLWVKPLEGGKYRKLRLDGLDAPEICQPGGLLARDALAARVLRQVVTVNERHRDHYGRALVHLTHQGEDVGAWLVVRGHAWAYRWRYGEGVYAVQESQARAKKKGIFADRDAEVPRDFRRRHGPCPLP